MASVHHTMPTSHRDPMAIDSLLNPPDTQMDSRLQRIYREQSHSPTTSSSPDRYYYSPFHDSHSCSDASGTSHDQSYFSYGLRSMNSSPNSYDRERYDSVSSTSSNTAERRRPPRPKYEEEEMYFIWYHRVDLCQEWKEVRESFNRQFPHRQRSGFQGIQCKFYRFIKEKKCPTLREQRRMRDGEFLREGSALTEPTPPKFGVVEWAGVWYPWMREDREQVLRHKPAGVGI